MAGETNSVKVFLADFTTPISTNIVGEPTSESLIEIHRLISGILDSVL